MCIKKIFKSGLIYLWVSIIILALDHITKFYANNYLTPYEPVPFTHFFNFTLAYNRGAAFSFMDKAGNYQGIIFGGIAIIVTLIILVTLFRTAANKRWFNTALALIVGGALGNLWDRIQTGYVTDWLDFHIASWHWPDFNLADSAICVGAIMLILEFFFRSKE